MKFKVPIEKDSKFSTDFFGLLSECVDILGRETGKWPNRITFTGSLGGEILNTIKESNWNLDRFELIHQNSPSSLMIIDYVKSLNQVDDVGLDGKSTFQHQTDNISGKTINGIPTEDTVNNFISHASFKIERSIRPELRVKLTR